MTNPWHDIPPGEDVPNEVNAIIEVPKDSRIKYELDKATGLIKLDRVLYSAVHYPGDYGFIPQTYWEDGDPLDILILSNIPVFPRTIVKARPIGVLEMIDGKEKDDKIIAVHASDPRFNNYSKLNNISGHIALEIKHFFETYKELQGKKVRVIKFLDVDDAKKYILKGIKTYKEKFKDKK